LYLRARSRWSLLSNALLHLVRVALVDFLRSTRHDVYVSGKDDSPEAVTDDALMLNLSECLMIPCNHHVILEEEEEDSNDHDGIALHQSIFFYVLLLSLLDNDDVVTNTAAAAAAAAKGKTVMMVAVTYTAVVKRTYPHYCCSRVVHQRMMGWKVVTFAPRRLRHDSFLLEKTLSRILVVSMVSNAYYHDGHFCSIDHSDDPCDCYNTAAAVGFEVVVDYCFPTQAPDHNHGEGSMMCANVDCIHYHSNDQDGSLLLWDHS